jgi:uncharacterized protein YukE
MDPSEITWNYAAIDGLASDTGQRAAQLRELHDDIQHRGQLLSDYFMGKGATGFFDALAQHLQGLAQLADHVELHQNQMLSTAETTQATDATVQTFFV